MRPPRHLVRRGTSPPIAPAAKRAGVMTDKWKPTRQSLIWLLVAVALGLAMLAPYAQRGPLNQDDVSGDFEYYVLALSWSPTHCATAEHRRDDAQCGRRDGRRYGFVLHGLWPQYDRGYPENCRMATRPWVPNSVIDAMSDIMPNRGLVIYQYKKHGTCSGLAPTQYYRLARNSFESIKIPARYRKPEKPQNVSQRQLIDEFVRANPKLKADMIVVSCGRGNRLREIHVCMTKDGQPRSCGSNQNQRRLCRAARLYVPPTRPYPGGGGKKTSPKGTAQPLPMPRIIDAPDTR